MTTPQNVSSRYVRNLLVAGRNSNFQVFSIEQKEACSPSGICCGTYYVAEVGDHLGTIVRAAEGATPEQAVATALGILGVTFA